MLTHDQTINWICDQIRDACSNNQGLCAEEILTLTCSLESSVEEYYLNCDAELTLDQIVENYLSDNPEYWKATLIKLPRKS
jgi:hypothetical protein